MAEVCAPRCSGGAECLVLMKKSRDDVVVLIVFFFFLLSYRVARRKKKKQSNGRVRLKKGIFANRPDPLQQRHLGEFSGRPRE